MSADITNIMNKNFFIFLIFFIPFILFSESRIGITRLYSDFRDIDPEFHSKLEDIFLSSLSTTVFDRKYSLNLKIKPFDFDAFLEIWKREPENITDKNSNNTYFEIYNEIKDLDIVVCPKIEKLNIYDEKDFYDTNITIYKFEVKIKFMIFDMKKKVMIDENEIELDNFSKKNFDDAKDQILLTVEKKTSSYFEDISNLNLKIKPVFIGKTIIRFNKGRNSGIKPGNLLIYNTSEGYSKIEHTAVRIIKSDDEECIGNIIYTKGNIPPDAEFIRQTSVYMELQLTGGFVISLPKDQDPLLYGNAGIRFLIPAGIVFFNPVVHFDFNFFYLATLENTTIAGSQGRLFLPFTIETGIQGKYNVQRFEFAAGFLVGILFSPDENNIYKVDAPVLRPYTHFAVLINSNFNLFAEFGYRYYVEDGFSKNWKTDLKGMYFSFGFGIDF